MAHYYFLFPKETKLDYIQPVKAKNIHEAWEIMNFFYKKFVGYGYTATQLISEGLFCRENFLPLLTKGDLPYNHE